MQRKYNFSIGEYYHVYNRGNNKNDIFKLNTDYSRFVLLLFIANSKKPVRIHNMSQQGRTLLDLKRVVREETLVDIGAYCLMPNHFHILIREKNDGGISSFIQKLATGYSMYFNKRHGRTGSLFEGKFKAEHVNRDEYLKYLFSYIHLNPIKLLEKDWKEVGIQNIDKAKNYLREYKNSSYVDYIGGDRVEKEILNTEAFPEYFNSNTTFQGFINEWLSYDET